MALTLRTTESTPAARPTVTGLSTAAAAVPAEVVWRRLEGWCGHRWGVRSVTVLVQGCGPYEPRLRPWALVTAETWNGFEWAAFTPEPHPLGIVIPGDNETMARLTLTVGDETATPDVVEAVRRLALWMAEAERELAAGSATFTDGADGDFSWKRSASWIAKSLHASGAADLLRPWRHMR